jgi:hypothetical protein
MIGIHNHVISFMNHACEKMSDAIGNGDKDDASLYHDDASFNACHDFTVARSRG